MKQTLDTHYRKFQQADPEAVSPMSELKTQSEVRAQTALIGFGPANLGLLVAAIRRGELESMTRGGLTIVDRRQQLGAGLIGQYRITANSLASVFVECVEDPRLGDVFAHVKAHSVLSRFRRSMDVAPRLSDVAAVMKALSEAVLAYVGRRTKLTLLRGSIAHGWAHEGGRHVFTVTRGDQNVLVVAETAFVNCGGRNRMLPQRTGRLAKRLVSSHTLLTTPDDALKKIVPADKPARIAILGGSHSAISCSQRLSSLAGHATVDIFSRSKLRLFYSSGREADEDEYAYDPDADVCPLSGRVNRFGGLRYDAHRAARSIQRDGRIGPDAAPVDIVVCDHPISAAEASGPFDVAVVATGYDADGPCGPTLGSERDGRVRDEDRRIIPGLYSFGLGSGLVPSPRIGGEPSFRGRLDGIWLYQNDVGDEVLDAYRADQNIPQDA